MKYLSVIFLSVFLILLTVGVRAQRTPQDTSGRFVALPAFDQPIDPDKYLIRPGERLVVTPVGGGILPVVLVVDPEGRIIDPKMGVVDVFGKTLTQIRSILASPLSQQYRAERIVVSVEGPRVVPIKVTGAVNYPGTFSAATSQRVSDIIKLAGGLKSSGSTRHIQFLGGPKPIRVDFELAASGLGTNSTHHCMQVRR